MRLLVDAGEFLGAVEEDVRSAQDSVLAQTMSFEGDYSGRQFANLLIRSRCPDRRIAIDCYTRHVLSDRFVHMPAPLQDAELRSELRCTAATLEAMRRAGVGVRFVNPAGPLLHRFAARSHKKSVVIDGRIAYLGGLNISDHNFAWHDLMLRLDDPGAAAFLAEDLEATWRSRPRRRWAEFDGIAIATTSGRHNPRMFEPLFDRIASARTDILVESPFLTFPFTDRLSDACRRGVRVRVIVPHPHPWRAMGRYLRRECDRCGFELWCLPLMTHVKAMLIDGRTLVLGSSNFDYLSFRVLQEILAIVTEPTVVRDFVRRVATVDLARSTPAPPPGRWHGCLHRSVMEAAGAAIVRLAGA